MTKPYAAQNFVPTLSYNFLLHFFAKKRKKKRESAFESSTETEKYAQQHNRMKKVVGILFCAKIFHFRLQSLIADPFTARSIHKVYVIQ